MDLLNNLALGLSVAVSFQNLTYALLGCMVGTLIGVLPGIGPVATIAMLLPITFHLPPTASLIMLAGIYYGAQYGGSTTSILVNLPGEASSVVTCLDGYQMARKGRAGAALSISAVGSFFAGTVGTIIIVHLRRAADAHGAEIRPGRLLLADGAGPGRGGGAGERLGDQGDRHGVPRPAVRPGRHRRQYRRAALHLRRPGTQRRHRLRADRHGPVRHRRDRGQPRTTTGAQRRRHQGGLAMADPRGDPALDSGRPARHRAGLHARRAAGRRPDPRRLLGLYPGEEDLQDIPRNSARARSRAWPRRRRRTTPRRRPRSFPC